MNKVQRAYSIRDTKAEIYNPPFYANTHGEAERELKQLTAADPQKSKIAAYPEDYDLFWIGEYDSATGKFKPLDAPQHIVKAVDLIRH